MWQQRASLLRQSTSNITIATQGDRFSNAWDFLATAVWTRDEASGKIRKFPADLTHNGEPRFGYLKYLTEERPKHKVCAYEKSRRMLVTWWMLALYLHDIMTQNIHLNAVASDKLEKSAYLLGPERMQFIYDCIPPVNARMENVLRMQGLDIEPFKADIWPNKPVVIFEGKQGKGWTTARCDETGSSCMAVASGESQMQQYTFSNVLMDEFPRWKWQEESWRNIQPTTQGGGHVDIICTAELGAFAYTLLYDTD